MPERTTKRPAGATRVTAPRDPAVDPSRLSGIDASGFSREQLVRALADRALSTNGSDEQLRTRLTTAVNGA